MSDKPWKRDERNIGKKLGMERTALSGSNGKITGADLIDDYWFPEIKRNGSGTRHDWTDGVLKFWNGLVPLAKEEGKKPMAIVHAGGTKLDDSIVMIPLSEFVKFRGQTAPNLSERDAPSNINPKKVVRAKNGGDKTD